MSPEGDLVFMSRTSSARDLELLQNWGVGVCGRTTWTELIDSRGFEAAIIRGRLVTTVAQRAGRVLALAGAAAPARAAAWKIRWASQGRVVEAGECLLWPFMFFAPGAVTSNTTEEAVAQGLAGAILDLAARSGYPYILAAGLAIESRFQRALVRAGFVPSVPLAADVNARSALRSDGMMCRVSAGR